MQLFKRKIEERIQVSEDAKFILNHRLVKEALDGIEQTIFYNFKTSKYKDKDEREELYRQLQSVRAFRDQFDRWIKDGQAARAELDQQLKQVV